MSIRVESLVPQSNGLSDNANRVTSKWALRGKRLLRSCLPASLLLCIAECRSLPHRIRLAARIRWDTSSPVLPSNLVSELQGVTVPSSCRHVYIRDMKWLQARHPFLTPFDLHIAALAWSAGIRCASRNSDIESGLGSSPSDHSLFSSQRGVSCKHDV